MTFTFVRNGWYVAGWSHEIAEKPVARRLGNEPVVLYRDAAGRAVALLDRCVHRGAALSLGSVTEEGLRCNYHGWVYNHEGHCTHIPAQKNVPAQAKVRAFPLVEKNKMLWIWLGDPALADPTKIVDFPFHDDEAGWPAKFGLMPIKANYMLMIDNLMDLTHVGYLHRGTIGSGSSAAHAEAEMIVERTATGVKFARWMINQEPPATYLKAVPFKGNVDRWQEFEFVAPGSVLQYSGATDTGTGAKEGRRIDGFHLRVLHALTPETDTTCHYFFSSMNGFLQHVPAVTQKVFDEGWRTFLEDKEFVEAEQARLEEYPDALVDSVHDTARIQARRVFDKLMAAEATK